MQPTNCFRAKLVNCNQHMHIAQATQAPITQNIPDNPNNSRNPDDYMCMGNAECDTASLNQYHMRLRNSIDLPVDPDAAPNESVTCYSPLFWAFLLQVPCSCYSSGSIFIRSFGLQHIQKHFT